MNQQEANKIHWSENVIIADGDYIDYVAFQLSIQFERMLGRRISKADLSKWIVNIALDGRMREGNHETQVVLLHEQQNTALQNFIPAKYDNELNGQAFKDDKLGEFIINCIATGEEISQKDDVMDDLLLMLTQHDEVKRIMVIPNGEEGESYNRVRAALRNADDEKQRITVFAMQPMQGGNFKQEILGFSLMNALGIRADELK